MLPSVCYVNGVFCKPEDAKISIFDRGLLFGDAIYEVVRVHRAQVFRMEDHYRRMSDGLAALRIKMPLSVAEYGALCSGLVKRSGMADGWIYLQITRGAADRDHHLPQGVPPTVVAFTRTAQMPGWKKHPDGVSAATVTDTRWQRCNLKTTMLLANTLAKQQAADAGAYEAVFVTSGGVVTEGCASSVFAVIAGVLRTHPAGPAILPSITRHVVLNIARDNHVPLREEAFSVSEMMSAAELFLVSTTNDICPIVQVDGKPIAGGVVGPVTRRLMGLLGDLLERECGGA